MRFQVENTETGVVTVLHPGLLVLSVGIQPTVRPRHLQGNLAFH